MSRTGSRRRCYGIALVHRQVRAEVEMARRQERIAAGMPLASAIRQAREARPVLSWAESQALARPLLRPHERICAVGLVVVLLAIAAFFSSAQARPEESSQAESNSGGVYQSSW